MIMISEREPFRPIRVKSSQLANGLWFHVQSFISGAPRIFVQALFAVGGKLVMWTRILCYEFI
jgi:hypothetical protein